MTKEITCHNCRINFTPDKVYEFPNYYVYWHVCMMGAITQNVVVKDKKYIWVDTKETSDVALNRTLDSFYDPWSWYRDFHSKMELIK